MSASSMSVKRKAADRTAPPGPKRAEKTVFFPRSDRP